MIKIEFDDTKFEFESIEDALQPVFVTSSDLPVGLETSLDLVQVDENNRVQKQWKINTKLDQAFAYLLCKKASEKGYRYFARDNPDDPESDGTAMRLVP